MINSSGNQEAFDELKAYGEKFGHLLQGLKQQDGLLEEQYSERELVFEKDKLKLYRYVANESKNDNSENNTNETSENKPTVKTPVLIVYALVNRPSILDLQQGHSAIEQMLESGLDVYLIDWGYPDESDKDLDLNYYINEQIDACVDLVCSKESALQGKPVKQVSVMGVCQGGVLGLCYSSLHPQRVKNIVTLVTPIDFHTKEDTLSNLVRYIDIDLMVKTMGNIPGDMLSNTFLSLRPYYLQLKKYLNLVDATDQLDEKSKERIANFILMERWIFDSPDQAGEAFGEFVKGCYQQNQLIKNTLKVGGCPIDLTNLGIPVLNIYANKDHLVPPASSKALETLIPKHQYQAMPVKGGHIGIFVSPKSVQTIFPAIADWLRQHS